MSYHLLLNQLEKIQISENLIFLDKHLSQSIKNKKINYKIYNHKILNSEERSEFYKLIYLLSEKILIELKDNLNLIHKTDYNIRSWKIIIGPWLQNFLIICYNRFLKIQSVLESSDISKVTIFSCDENNFVPLNNSQLNTFSNSDDWNSVLYSKILLYLNPKIHLSQCNLNININNEYQNKSWLKNILSVLSNLLVKKKDALIIGTYLPFIEILKLSFYLKQVPQVWKFKRIFYEKYNLNLRNKIILSKGSNLFEIFVKKIIPFSIPICHLESFNNLKDIVYKLPFPEKPKFIFTSNNYEYDEIFKLYTAIKIKNNTKYIIGQHGNTSWIEDIFFEKLHSADNYLKWGKNGFGKGQDGFNFKLVNKKIKNNNNGRILILDSPFGTNNKIFNRLDENFTKEIWLHKIINSLKPDIQNQITIKLHSSYKEREFDYIQKIRNISPNIKIETENRKLTQLLNDCRCVIHCYDSTGILETMALNIPTFCIWPYELNHIQKKYHNLYNDLKKKNILFFDPNELSTTINNNWNNLNLWWKNIERIKIKKMFLDTFSIIPEKNSIKNLSKKLLDLSKN